MTFRGLLMWVHLALGVSGAVIIAIVSVTGAYLTFRAPLTRWLNPIPQVAAFDGTPDAELIVSRVEAEYAPRRVASIEYPAERLPTVVRLRDRSAVFVNPSDATIIGSRHARFASLENLNAVMRRLHTNLVLGPKAEGGRACHRRGAVARVDGALAVVAEETLAVQDLARLRVPRVVGPA